MASIVNQDASKKENLPKMQFSKNRNSHLLNKEKTMAINNEKDLGKALKDDQETIEIEGSLKDKVIKIKATGKVAWIVAVGAIGVAVVAILYPVPEPATQTGSKGIAVLTGGAAVAILGAGTAVSAITIAVAAGGVAALNKLRDYKIISNTGDKIVLKKS